MKGFVYCINNRGLEKYLTLDKKYEVTDPHNLDEELGEHTIVNDAGAEFGYSRSRFAESGSQRWRERQLKKLL